MMHFTAHFLQKHENTQFDRLNDALGTKWTRKEAEVMAKNSGSSKTPGVQPTQKDEITVPLSMVINPQLRDFIIKQFGQVEGGTFIAGGDYRSRPYEQVVELDENFSKEQFKAMAARLGSTGKNPVNTKRTKHQDIPEQVRDMHRMLKRK